LYLNGAEGDQSPVADAGADDFNVWKSTARNSRHWRRNWRPLSNTKPDMPIGFCLWYAGFAAAHFSEGSERKYQAYAKAAQEALPKQTSLQLLRIGPVTLAGLPGEPIMEVGQAVEKKLKEMGVEHPLAVGLANDYIGYIVNEKEYAHGGYEVESRSYYGPELGRFMVEHIANISTTILMQK
jgi:hypothetical protein